MKITARLLDWVSLAFKAPLARIVAFSVLIDARLVFELLVIVILYLHTYKSYIPPEMPLTEEETDELCEEWVLAPLHPPITEEMQAQPPTMESVAGPHTVIDIKEVVNLASANCFGLIGRSFGVLGNSGRELAEYYGVPVEKIDIITAGMGNALATDGSFCAGSVKVADHQRLSSSGYVFSASSPPYLASAAITAVDYLEENSSVLAKLRNSVAFLWKGLSDVLGLVIATHLFLKPKKSTGSPNSDLKLLDTCC